MIEDLNGKSIMLFHDKKTAEAGWAESEPHESSESAWHWIEENHRYNTLLWAEEDKARRTDVDAAEIARSKRLIDRYNQKRNDAVEAIDESILGELADCPRRSDARLNSETAGAMIDRLSILSLKIFHMELQTHRPEASRAHVLACADKLARLMVQRQDLAACLDRLLVDASRGDAYFKVYRQFKMYNDPALNPYLYGAQSVSGERGAAP